MTDADPEVARDERTGLTVLTDEECDQLLDSTPIGRIAYVVGNQPVVLPVNYGWHENSIVFRTTDGQKLLAAILEQPVAFEVDQWDETTRSASSVVVKGVAREVIDWAEREQLENLGVVPWSKHPWRRSCVAIDATAVTGRRIEIP